MIRHRQLGKNLVRWNLKIELTTVLKPRELVRRGWKLLCRDVLGHSAVGLGERKRGLST
jgi:hypothetical protein